MGVDMATVDEIAESFASFDELMKDHVDELTEFFVKQTENDDYELAVGALRYMSRYANVGMVNMDTWLERRNFVYLKFKGAFPNMKEVMAGLFDGDYP